MRARNLQLLVGTQSLQAPALFASYRLGDYPTSGLKCLPWAITQTEAVLINAYDFTRPKYAAWLNNGWNPNKYLQVGRRPFIIDSGAYYFLKDTSISVSPQDILKIELQSKAHVGVALDHPFPPDAKDKQKRIATTIHNTHIMAREMADVTSSMALMPVIHGHTKRQLLGCIQRLRQIADRQHQPLLNHVGIGSLAPLAQRGDATLAVEVIRQVRTELPNSQIHCFSMGSALLMLLAFYSGADSVDSQTWMVSAGFKLAQLPGHYVTRMAMREYNTEARFNQAMQQFQNRLGILADEEGFTAKNWISGDVLDLTGAAARRQYVADLVDLVSNEHVHNRACHNLWSFNFEVRRYRAAQRKGLLDQFMEGRLRNSRYANAFEHARNLRRHLK